MLDVFKEIWHDLFNVKFSEFYLEELIGTKIQ